MAWVWKWFYQPVPIGLFDGLLVSAGLSQQPFLRSTEQALYAVLAPAVWAGFGFQIVIFLAGLKAMPQEYYEAAAIEAPGAARRWWTSRSLSSGRPSSFSSSSARSRFSGSSTTCTA